MIPPTQKTSLAQVVQPLEAQNKAKLERVADKVVLPKTDSDAMFKALMDFSLEEDMKKIDESMLNLKRTEAIIKILRTQPRGSRQPTSALKSTSVGLARNTSQSKESLNFKTVRENVIVPIVKVRDQTPSVKHSARVRFMIDDALPHRSATNFSKHTDDKTKENND